MRKLRVLALLHEGYEPPAIIEKWDKAQRKDDWKMEYDILWTLQCLGHEVRRVAVFDELGRIRTAIDEFKPHVVFNLLEHFHGITGYDMHVVSYLELLRVPYTGCNPRGLMLARDKGLAKRVLTYSRIRMPDFVVYPRGRKVRRPKSLAYPLIVKSLIEESSIGISQASVVHDDEKLAERVAFIHDSIGTDALVESYIEGRELYVAVVGDERLRVFPTWELVFQNAAPGTTFIATARAKRNRAYQERHGITAARAQEIPPALERELDRVSRRIYKGLGLSGYARLDFRLAPDGRYVFLEANPNPDISMDEEFAQAAAAAGLDYESLLQSILTQGLRHLPPE